jgi:hypothetical protein
MSNLLTKIKSTLSSGLQAIQNEDRPQASPPSPESVKSRYEHKDANTFGIFLAAISVMVIGILIQGLLSFGFFQYRNHKMNTQVSQKTPPPDFLEGSAPTQKLSAYRTRMIHELNSYGWIDRDHQIVHIPIETAMKKLADRSGHEK